MPCLSVHQRKAGEGQVSGADLCFMRLDCGGGTNIYLSAFALHPGFPQQPQKCAPGPVVTFQPQLSHLKKDRALPPTGLVVGVTERQWLLALLPEKAPGAACSRYWLHRSRPHAQVSFCLNHCCVEDGTQWVIRRQTAGPGRQGDPAGTLQPQGHAATDRIQTVG